MRNTQSRASRTGAVARALLGSSVVAAGILGFAPVAAAEQQPAAPPADRPAARVAHLDLGIGTQTRSSSSGGRSGDFTGDGRPDILARAASTGQLKVYPHSGSYNGTATYQAPSTINYGWGSIRWIGQGNMTGSSGIGADGDADVVYVDNAGVMRIAPHQGTFNGTSTLGAGVWVGSGWNINDLIYTADANGDGYDDVLGRRAGTGDTYVYYNTGGVVGPGILQAPQVMITGGDLDVEQQLADYTGDGVLDQIFVQSDGLLGLFDLEANGGAGEVYLLGTGWQTINAVVQTDVNLDGRADLLGRRAIDGRLQAYTHTGVWNPAQDGTAFGTFNAPTVIGYNWHSNNVIT